MDAPIQGLIALINAQSDVYTTSSCSGRISVFAEPNQVGGGGRQSLGHTCSGRTSGFAEPNQVVSCLPFFNASPLHLTLPAHASSWQEGRRVGVCEPRTFGPGTGAGQSQGESVLRSVCMRGLHKGGGRASCWLVSRRGRAQVSTGVCGPGGYTQEGSEQVLHHLQMSRNSIPGTGTDMPADEAMVVLVRGVLFIESVDL